MELMLLFLLSPAIIAQKYAKSNDPNDEPFLPIYPVYPYSPKLIKRGIERDAYAQLSPELYAPKVDAKDSYSASYSTNYPRDPYYPNYNPYPKSPASSAYSSYYNAAPYSYTSPYNSYASPYAVTPAPYTSVPYSGASYPNYYYQQPYYYPNYYNQPMFPPPPPVPGADYPGSKDPYSDSESNEKDQKSAGSKKSRENEANKDSSGNQYIDGGNYISNSKDLDGQSSTHKAAKPYNQIEQVQDMKNIQLPVPKTTYRVISVAGQPVGPDYPLPAPYVKAQQLEQLMSQTLANLLAQNHQSDSQRNGDPREPPRFVAIPNAIAKTGLAYVVNPNVIGKLAQGNSQVIQAPTTLTKAKYPAWTQVNLEQSPGLYVPENSDKEQATSQQSDYDNYDNESSQSSQSYDGTLGQSSKSEQNYEGQSHPASDRNQNYVTAQTPRAYGYQYANYNPAQTAQQESQLYKTNLEDVNFGAKQNNKG